MATTDNMETAPLVVGDSEEKQGEIQQSIQQQTDNRQHQLHDRRLDDDPYHVWVFIILGVICTPICCCIGLAVNDCGRDLGPNRKRAYRILVIVTIIASGLYVLGIIWGGLLFVGQS